MPQLKDLDYPQLHAAMHEFASMPQAQHCVGAWLSSMQGTDRRLIEPLVAALEEYHEHVAHVGRHLRENV